MRKNKYEKKELELKHYLIILGVVIMFVIGINVFNPTKTDNLAEKNTNQKFSIVKDYSTYFTIENCINRFISYTVEEPEKGINLLTTSFKKENDLNSDNINDYFKYKTTSKYNAIDIYSKKGSRTIEYILKGENKVESLNNDKQGNIEYYKVFVNQEEYTYMIEKIDESKFEEELK